MIALIAEKPSVAKDIARIIGRRPCVRGEAAPSGVAGDAVTDAAAHGSASAAATPAPRVSGALAAHYAPRTPLRLVHAAQLADHAAVLAGEGSRVAVLAHAVPNPDDSRLIWQAMPADPAAYAQELYASLRTLDALNADFILIEALPEGLAWRALADRLGRAAVGSGAAAD